MMAHICGPCQKEFRTRANYNRHQKGHERPHKCHVCNQAFGLKSNLNRHKLSIHQSRSSEVVVNGLRCRWPGCSTETTREDYLKKHMRKKHGQLIPGAPAVKQERIKLDVKIAQYYGDSIREYRALITTKMSDVDLLEAIALGNEEILLQSIAKGFNPNFKDANGQTFLSIAALKGHESICRTLLPHISDLDILHHALIQAVGSNTTNYTLVQLLVEAGANPTHQAGYRVRDRTALHIAVDKGNEPLIKLLLSNAGFRANKTTDDCLTGLLRLACELGRKTVIKLLLEAGANINSRYTSGAIILHEASQRGNKAVIKLLLEASADINSENKFGTTTLLYEASKSGHEAVVKLLLETGADVNLKNEFGTTALHESSQRGFEAVVKLLLEAGADINSENKFGTTALYEASKSGHEAVVKLLLETGADVNLKNKFGTTALHESSQRGFEAVIKLLLKAGADTNSENKFGTTALYEASKSGHEAVVKLLLETGAGANSSSALFIALEEGHDAVSRLLLEHEANIEGESGAIALRIACMNGNYAAAKFLLDHAVDIEKLPDTAVYVASSNGHLDVLKLLLDHGVAGINTVSDGETALYLACKYGHIPIVKMLIESGADFNVKLPFGSSLHGAVESGNEDLVRMLLAAGAETHHKRPWNPYETALDMARRLKFGSIIKILLENGAVEG